jgi:heme A synthase
MLPLAKIAASVVTLALISYSIAILTEQRRRKVINRVLVFLTLGVVLDMSSTAMMIIVSENSPFTLHGILGYSSLTLMIIDAILLWRYRMKNGPAETVVRPVHLYSRIAYIWWVAAYLTGSLMVMLK